MLTELCRELRNWFLVEQYFGEFTITDGEIDDTNIDLQPNQYYRIIGSVFNDGVHQHKQVTLTDETFNGAVWTMAVPAEVVTLANDINDFVTEYGKASPYTSESWGGYSYTKATGEDGGAITWKTAFASRMNNWRKV